MFHVPRSLVLLLATFTTLLSPIVNAHSWVEQLTVIAPNGTFVGAPGYARGNVLRTDPAFSDTALSYLIPPNGRPNATHILPTDSLCKDTQRKQVQTPGSPRLQAYAGAAIALRFQENGHVTLPQNQPGKPPNRGTIYVYGTTRPRADEKLLDVHKVWTRDGKGGDGRGVLLTVQDYDDGRCYQINGGEISVKRQAEFPHEADPYMGTDLWCQTDLGLPDDLPTGQPYTLYWVWDWPTAPRTDPALPLGKEEIYTTCMDVDIGAHVQTYVRVPMGFASDQSLNRAAIPKQFAEIVSGQGGSSSAVPSPSPSASFSSSRLIVPPSSVVTLSTPGVSAAPTRAAGATATVTTFVTVTTTATERGCM